MEMSKVRNTVLVPTALLVVAGVLLIALLIRAQVVLAPTPTMYHGSSNPAPISQQTITAQGSTTPLAPRRRCATGAPTQHPVPSKPPRRTGRPRPSPRRQQARRRRPQKACRHPARRSAHQHPAAACPARFPNPGVAEASESIGAHARIRTGDLFLTKEMLYRLSYVGGASVPILSAAARPPVSG